MTDHPSALVSVPRDDDQRPFSDSLLPEAMIYAGSDALDRAQMDMANYVSGETIDWDHGMIAVAVYRAMLAAAPAAPQAAGVGEERFYRRVAKIVRELGPSMSPGALAATCERRADKEALRAQPQAREDAQPVAWAIFWRHSMTLHPTLEAAETARKGVPHDIVPLYTHPAPDALRVAVEALEPFAAEAQRIRAPQSAKTIMDNVELWQCGSANITRTRLTYGDLRKAVDALAALQAEQGAK